MKHLHEKNEQFSTPNKEILDIFTDPGVDNVQLEQKEFTSLCPLTGQPDYAVITITYTPREYCLESKSLKLYLSAYRSYKGFAETIVKQIWTDLFEVLDPIYLVVRGEFTSRGGIKIAAIKEDV